MSALGDGVSPDVDHGSRLCQLLGLDPAETVSISVTVQAGGNPACLVEWHGGRKIPLDRFVDALAEVVDPDPPVRPTTENGPDGMRWTYGTRDPWSNGKASGEPPC